MRPFFLRLIGAATAATMVVVAGCAPKGGGAGTVKDGSISPSSSSSASSTNTNNAIDRIVSARFAALGVTTPRADAYEVCRRLAIDLLGRGPTPEELKACTTARSIEPVVDAWMARPEHDTTERRVWADLAAYDITTTWYNYIIDLDNLVGTLATGTINYDEFASRFILHPAFYSRHPDDDWTRQIFSMFLGRTARPDEVRALRPLVGVWAEAYFADPKLSPNGGQQAREVGFDFCACDNVVGGCKSNALGRPIELKSCVPASADNKVANNNGSAFGTAKSSAALRYLSSLQGADPTTKGRLVRLLSIGDEAHPMPHASSEQEASLLSIGAALSSRLDFWEAAVDREMRRYLGWWQTGFKRPDADLPEVRAALAADFAKHKNLRTLRRTILTSVLYTMPSGARSDLPKNMPANVAALPWMSGPRKLLAGEAWLDTMGLALNEKLGSCDYRFVMPAQYMAVSAFEDEAGLGRFAEMYIDQSLISGVNAKDKSTLIDVRTMKPFQYARSGRRIGGCGMGRSPSSSLGLAQAERELAQVLCAGAGDGLKPVVKGTLEDDARRLVERMLSRPASNDEAKRLAGDMRACMTPAAAAGKSEAACRDREVANRWLCTRIATSVEFGTY